jgi:uncharacterized protein
MLDNVTLRPPSGTFADPLTSPDAPPKRASRALARTAILGAGLGAYALVEPRLFRLNRITAPVTAGAPGLDILHLSDTHMTAGRTTLQRWLEGLPKLLGEPPDLTVATGDFIEDDSGIDPIVEALGRLGGRLGSFYVFGSHDYYQSKFQAYTKYVTKRRPVNAPHAATDRLVEGLASAGWTSVVNESTSVESERGTVRITGVDDPYISRHRTGHIGRESNDVLAIGLTHAPDVVSEYALAGYDLVVGGHTHAGQVRVPGIGAIVTNCTLPAPLAGGLNRVGDTWLHVSPGLGSGRFAPIRFNCRPEATLIRLQPR